jgi:plasmid maintenance system killer protein
VDITFSTRKLEKQCNDSKTMTRAWGAFQAKKLRQRLDELKAASTLEVMRLLPGRCHELKGDRAGQISLDLEHPNRLVFEPANVPIPRKQDGGLNWTAITAVRIIGVVDTHD